MIGSITEAWLVCLSYFLFFVFFEWRVWRYEKRMNIFAGCFSCPGACAIVRMFERCPLGHFHQKVRVKVWKMELELNMCRKPVVAREDESRLITFT